MNISNYYDQITDSHTRENRGLGLGENCARENKFSPEKKRRHPAEQTHVSYPSGQGRNLSADMRPQIFEDQKKLPNIAPSLNPTKKNGYCYFYNETEQKNSIFAAEKCINDVPGQKNIFRKKGRENISYSNSLPRKLPPGGGNGSPNLVGKSKFILDKVKLDHLDQLDNSNSNSYHSINGKKKIIDLAAGGGKIIKSRLYSDVADLWNARSENGNPNNSRGGTGLGWDRDSPKKTGKNLLDNQYFNVRPRKKEAGLIKIHKE